MAFVDLLIYVTTFFGLYTSFYFLLVLFENRKNLYLKETDKYPKVTICVPCYNEEKTIIKTLKSLCALDYDKKQLEIIVVDDGSKDSTFKKAKEFVKTHPENNILVFRKVNGGKYTALNFALKKASGEFFGALDADSFVDSKALRRIIPYFTRKSIVAVTPSMKVYNPKSFLQRVQAIEYLIGIFLRKIFAELGSIHVTPGPFSIYRISFFKKHGFFEESFQTEDIEMALRAQRYDYEIENAVDAYVYTVAPKKWVDLYRQRLRWYFGFIKNVIKYKKLFGTGHGNLGIFILPASFISVFLVILSLFYIVYKEIDVLIRTYFNLASINFDIFSLKFFKWDWFFVNSTPSAVLGILALLVGIVVVIIAKRISGEKKSIFRSYIFFMLSYWLLFGFWWIVSIIHIFLKKKVFWGHKSES